MDIIYNFLKYIIIWVAVYLYKKNTDNSQIIQPYYNKIIGVDEFIKKQDTLIKNLIKKQNTLIKNLIKEQDGKIKNLIKITDEKNLIKKQDGKIKNLKGTLQKSTQILLQIKKFNKRCELNKYKSIKRSNVYYRWNKKRNHNYAMYFFDCINNFISDNNINININKEYNFEIDVNNSLYENNEQYSEKTHNIFNSSLMLKICGNIYIVYRYTNKNEQKLIFHCEFDDDEYLKYMFVGCFIDTIKLPYEKWYSINELPINLIREYGSYNIIHFYPKKNFIKFYSWFNNVQIIYV
jgi:hypothetical protein